MASTIKIELTETIKIELTEAEAAVLLRCLRYGEAAVSAAENKALIGDFIRQKCETIRRKVERQLSNLVIAKGADK